MRRNNIDHLDVQGLHSGGRLKRAIVYSLAAVLGLFAGGLLYVWLLLGSMGFASIPIINSENNTTVESGASLDINQSVSGIYSPAEYPIKQVKPKSKDVTNILVFGLDERDPDNPGAPSRTDAMIVLSMDRKNKAIKLTSLMRDIEAHIEGREGAEDKLNAAYVHGGIGMLINTINEMFNLDIQHFMKLDFWSAAQFIDAAGGVTIDVTYDELDYVNGGVREQSTLAGISPQLLSDAGTQKLNGMQAISWARIRAIGNDQGRTSRQRTVMMNMIGAFSSQSMTGKLGTITAALPYATTNFSRESLMLFGMGNLQTLKHMAEYRVPEDGMYYTDESNYNIIVDLEVQNPALHEFIYEKVVE